MIHTASLHDSSTSSLSRFLAVFWVFCHWLSLLQTVAAFGQYSNIGISARSPDQDSYSYGPAPDASLSLVQNAACQILASELPDQLSYPSSPEYANETAGFWSKTAVLSPGPYCVFSAYSSADVANAIKILTATNSRFAVRGYGHMPVPSAASTNDGVLIVMTTMRDLAVAPDHKSVTIRPGLNWGDVYSALRPYKLMVLGGRYAPVGTSGLLLGGGISYYSSVYGWAANQVRRYEIVTADGNVRQVTAQTYPDLFWALKGGSNNFGIVTEFELNTVPRLPVFAGTRVSSGSQQNRWIQALGEYISPGGGIEDSNSAIDGYITIIPSQKKNPIKLYSILFHNGPDPDPESLKGLASIPAVENTAKVQDFSDFQDETVSFGTRSYRQTFYTTSFTGSVESIRLINQTITQAALDRFADIKDSYISLIHQPVSKSWLEAAQKAGGDAIALDPSRGNFIIFDLNIHWSEPEDDALAYQFSQDMLMKLDAAAQEKNLSYPFLFMNDAGPGERVIQSYGYGASLEKLKQIRRKYDPLGIFQALCGGGFKVGL